MKYIGEFVDLNNKEYKIEITTAGSNETKSITLSGNPFTTEMKSDGKHLYSPIKTVGATVRILTKDYPFDIYSGKAIGTKVVLSSENKIIWTGYVTPCIYDMGFDEESEEIEIECMDGIAALKDIPFLDNEYGIATFKDIIIKCLNECKCYTSFYITDNVLLTPNGNDSVIEKFRISLLNFFDLKNDINQTDDDVAWSCYDVLFEICQYLGYTLFADGEEIFIIDYDAVKKGNNKYFKYSLNGGESSSVILSCQKHIDGNSYSENGTKISLDEIYNKITVKDNFYTFDNLFPDFGDEHYETNVTNGTYDYRLKDWYNFGTNNNYLESDSFVRTNKIGANTNFVIMISKYWRDRMCVLIEKYFESPVLSFEKYDNLYETRPNITDDSKWDNMRYTYQWDAHGAYYVKYYKRDISSEEYNKWRANYPSNWDSMDDESKYLAWKNLLIQEPTLIALTPMIVMLNHDLNHIGPGDYNVSGEYRATLYDDCRNYPFIKLKGNRSSSIFGGDGAYLIISGSFTFHDKIETPFPIEPSDAKHLKREGDKKYIEEGFLWARLKWGDLYWNGMVWSEEPSDFKIRFWDSSNGDKEGCILIKNCYAKEFEFIDTALAIYGCSEKGVYIPAPVNVNLNGKAEFIIYGNKDMWGRSNHSTSWKGYDRYYSKVVLIKNLTIKALISNGLLDDEENDSDTVYTNVIDNGSVKKMDEITFKICTYDGKKPTYSSVDYQSDKGSVYVDKTYNKALIEEEKTVMGSDGDLLRLEEHLIFKLSNQYEEPKVIMECNLKNDGYKLYGIYTDKTLDNRTFVISETTIDYRMCKQNIKLIEKK